MEIHLRIIKISFIYFNSFNKYKNENYNNANDAITEREKQEYGGITLFEIVSGL